MTFLLFFIRIFLKRKMIALKKLSLLLPDDIESSEQCNECGNAIKQNKSIHCVSSEYICCEYHCCEGCKKIRKP
jgi:hypothetical protein